MTDQTQFLINQAINAVKAGDLTGARKLLESVLEQDPDNQNAWLWMSAAVSTDDERRHCLEQILRLDPENAQARRGLEKLGGTPSAAKPTITAGGAFVLDSLDAPAEGEQDIEKLMADFAAFDTAAGQQAPKETPGEGLPAFTWALEPEQRDLAPDETGEADLEALFKSFDAQSEPGAGDSQAFEWGFEDDKGTAAQEAEKPAAFGGQLTGEEALDRFLGVQPPGDEKRGFYEEDARQGKAVPAFTMDEETEQVFGSTALGGAGLGLSEGGHAAEAFASPELPDTDFSFDIDRITNESQETDLAALGDEQALIAREMQGSEYSRTASPGLRLWANPGGKAHSVVILRDEYLVLANPDPLFIERIREEVERGEVKKKSLGRTAKAISLKSVLRVEGEPESSGFMVTYLKGKQKLMLNAEFESTAARDEALEALAGQLGPGFQKVEENVKRSKLVLLPIVVMVLACLGTPLLAYVSTLLLGMPESLTDLSLTLILPLVIGLAGFLVFAGGLLWLVSKLRQPLRLVAIVPAAGSPAAGLPADEMDARMTAG